MKKIRKDRFFVQITYGDLCGKARLISLFRINCEIYINSAQLESFNVAELERIAAFLDKKFILRRVHAPICDPEKQGFEVYKEVYIKVSKFCKIIGADSVVMHLEGEWPADKLRIWIDIADLAKKDNITLLLENHRETSASPIVDVLRAINSEYLRACFDVGHFNAFAGKDIISCLRDYPKGHIKEIHLSDNIGDADTHLPLGKGNIDFVRFFEAAEIIGLEPFYTLEAKNVMGMLTGISYLHRIGRL